jgi:hypothetical protein
VAEQGEPGLERGEPARRAAVFSRVGAEIPLRLVQAGDAGEDVDVVEDVAEDEDAVGLAPEGDVARGMARDVEDPEARDLVSLVEPAVDRVAGAGEDLDEELGDEMVGLALADQLGVLGGVGVGLADLVGDAEALADGVTRALVVRVRVGEGVGVDRAALDLAQDAAAGVAAGRVDQHITDHVDVDRVRRKAGEHPDVGGELLHGGASLSGAHRRSRTA